MSTITTNYEFIKPELTDAADITAMNTNWDILDDKLKSIEGSGDVSLDAKVNKSGDSLTGMLTFNNDDEYYVLYKYRKFTTGTYGVNLGCGLVAGQGVAAIEVRQGDSTSSPLLGRLEIGDLGVSYLDSEGKRTYLAQSEVISATVE